MLKFYPKRTVTFISLVSNQYLLRKPIKFSKYKTTRSDFDAFTVINCIDFPEE